MNPHKCDSMIIIIIVSAGRRRQVITAIYAIIELYAFYSLHTHFYFVSKLSTEPLWFSGRTRASTNMKMYKNRARNIICNTKCGRYVSFLCRELRNSDYFFLGYFWLMNFVLMLISMSKCNTSDKCNLLQTVAEERENAFAHDTTSTFFSAWFPFSNRQQRKYNENWVNDEHNNLD